MKNHIQKILKESYVDEEGKVHEDGEELKQQLTGAWKDFMEHMNSPEVREKFDINPPKGIVDFAWTELDKYLKKNDLPTEDGGTRKSTISEFMLMAWDKERHVIQFKHDAMRNYLYLQLESGQVWIPQGDKAFKKGYFDDPYMDEEYEKNGYKKYEK